MTQEKNKKDKFIILLTGRNKEVAFGPFDSIEAIGKSLQELGFQKINDTWWQKGKTDVYVRTLFPPEEASKEMNSIPTST